MEDESRSTSFEVSPDRLTIFPGDSQVATLNISNNSDVVDIYTISLRGEWLDWFHIPSPTVSLFPGTSATRQIVCTVPKSPEAEPKVHSVEVLLEGKQAIHKLKTTNMLVEIPAHNDLGSSLSVIEEKTNFCSIEVHITNNGNHPIRCELKFETPGLNCALNHRIEKVEVPAYEKSVVPITISTKRNERPFTGITRAFDVLAVLTTDQQDLEAISISSNLIISPIINQWLLISSVAVVIFLALAIALLVN